MVKIHKKLPKSAPRTPKAASKTNEVDLSAIVQTERDFKDALLTVSIFANLFVLSLWVALQTTAQYDNALAEFFLQR